MRVREIIAEQTNILDMELGVRNGQGNLVKIFEKV